MQLLPWFRFSILPPFGPSVVPFFHRSVNPLLCSIPAAGTVSLSRHRAFRSARREAGRKSARPLCLIRPREAFCPIEGRRRMSRTARYLLGLISILHRSFQNILFPQRSIRPILHFKNTESDSKARTVCLKNNGHNQGHFWAVGVQPDEHVTDG